jgi:hypothetical protein
LLPLTETRKSQNAGFAAAHDIAPLPIPGRQMLQGPTAVVLVPDASLASRCRAQAFHRLRAHSAPPGATPRTREAAKPSRSPRRAAARHNGARRSFVGWDVYHPIIVVGHLWLYYAHPPITRLRYRKKTSLRSPPTISGVGIGTYSAR